MVDSKPAGRDDDLEPLTQEERDSLARAWRDYRAGRVIPHDDVMDELRRRYDRRDKTGS